MLFDSAAPLITHRAQVRSLLQGFFSSLTS
jgi:hypothetical protein